MSTDIDIVRSATDALVDRNIQSHISYIASDILWESVSGNGVTTTRTGRDIYLHDLEHLPHAPPNSGFLGFDIVAARHNADNMDSWIDTIAYMRHVSYGPDGRPHMTDAVANISFGICAGLIHHIIVTWDHNDRDATECGIEP